MGKQKPLASVSQAGHVFVQQHETRATVSSRPIPDAAELQAYARVRPDLPDILIEEWRTEAASRRSLANKTAELAEREVAIRERVASNTSRNDTLRLVLGAAFVAGALYLAWLLVVAGDSKSAIAMTSLPALASLVSAGIKFLKK